MILISCNFFFPFTRARRQSIVKGKVHLGTTINLEQTVYRNLDRDRRRVNPDIVQERPEEKASRVEAEELEIEEIRTEAEELERARRLLNHSESLELNGVIGTNLPSPSYFLNQIFYEWVYPSVLRSPDVFNYPPISEVTAEVTKYDVLIS